MSIDKTDSLAVNKTGGAKVFEIASLVADELRRRYAFGQHVTDIVYDTATEILSREPSDFISISVLPAPAATYHSVVTFLFDKFRQDLTDAANKRLLHNDDPPLRTGEP